MPHFKICADDEGVRFDRFLRKKCRSLPLSEIYKLIRKGKITVNNKRVKQNYRLCLQDIIEHAPGIFELDEKETDTLEKIESLVNTVYFRDHFKILYEDEFLIVCNKPRGVVVHGGSGHTHRRTLIDMAHSYLIRSSGSDTKPYLVHRLDKDTSGVLLIAKNIQVLRGLHDSLRRGHITKLYTAFCHGVPEKSGDTVSMKISKTYNRNRGTKMKVSDDGVSSTSTYRCLEKYSSISKIHITLHTGRTHQIRVQLSHLGYPIVGDKRYGVNEFDTKVFAQYPVVSRLYLHACRLTFHHPGIDRNVTFDSPLPESFHLLEDILRKDSIS